MRTDRETDTTKLSVAFRNSAKTPKSELRTYAIRILNSSSILVPFKRRLHFRMKLVYWLRIMESTEAYTGCRQAALVNNIYHSNDNKAYIIVWTVMKHLVILYIYASVSIWVSSLGVKHLSLGTAATYSIELSFKTFSRSWRTYPFTSRFNIANEWL
jgi:hypothetical protein